MCRCVCVGGGKSRAHRGDVKCSSWWIMYFSVACSYSNKIKWDTWNSGSYREGCSIVFDSEGLYRKDGETPAFMYLWVLATSVSSLVAQSEHCWPRSDFSKSKKPKEERRIRWRRRSWKILFPASYSLLFCPSLSFSLPLSFSLSVITYSGLSHSPTHSVLKC